MVNVTIILDKSGSMATVKKSTISGFNEYVQTLKKDKKNEYQVSLVLFDTDVDAKFYNKPLKNLKELSDEDYMPEGGTALYDAACETINDLCHCVGHDDKKIKNLVMIMTDGEENSSQTWSSKDFEKLVKRLEKKGNFTFVFMGANQDSWTKAEAWGFKPGNVANFNASHRGVGQVFASMAMNTVTLANSATMDSANFYSDEDKKTLEDTK